MRIFTFIFLIVVAPLSMAQPSASSVLPIEHWTTSQGARVYFISSAAVPILDVQVTFDAGSSRDGSQYGVAQLTSNMIDEGTAHLTADQIAARFDNLGALINSYTERDMASISLRCLTESKVLEPTLQTFLEVLSQTSFPETEFKREQKQLLSAIQLEHQSPGDLEDNIFNKAIYGDSPYGHPVLGTTNTITALKTSDVKNFYKKYYVSSNAVISIVGDITRQTAEKIASRISLALPQGTQAIALPRETPLQKSVRIHVPFPSTQTHISIGEVGITPNDPDYFPLVVGNHILGGGILVSRLTNEIREKRGLAYVAKSELLPMMNGGTFEISMQTRNDRAQEALKSATETLRQFLTQGPTEEEITAAKENLTSSFPLRFSNNASIARILTMIGFYQRPLNYLDTYKEKISAVTREQIMDAFKRHIDPDKMAVVTLGNS